MLYHRNPLSLGAPSRADLIESAIARVTAARDAAWQAMPSYCLNANYYMTAGSFCDRGNERDVLKRLDDAVDAWSESAWFGDSLRDKVEKGEAPLQPWLDSGLAYEGMYKAAIGRLKGARRGFIQDTAAAVGETVSAAAGGLLDDPDVAKRIPSVTVIIAIAAVGLVGYGLASTYIKEKV